MQYSKNEQWGGITTPVATRFITSYDESNAKLTSLDTYFATVSSFSPDLVLFSGLHLMEREEQGFLLQKLAEVRRGFDGITVPVHLELASMANPRCVKDILNQVTTYMSHCMRKPAFCICVNKGADRLRSNRTADQHLCFRMCKKEVFS